MLKTKTISLRCKHISVQSVCKLDADGIEVIRRKYQNFRFAYRIFGSDQLGSYERVSIDGKNKTRAIDCMDGN